MSSREAQTYCLSRSSSDDGGRTYVLGRAALPDVPWGQFWAAAIGFSASIGSAVLLATGASHGFFVSALALTVAVTAAWFDAAFERIPNRLTYTAVVLGLTINTASLLPSVALNRWLGAAGPTESLVGFAICAALGFACVLSAGMGGGDMKLLAAMGALCGINRAAPMLVLLIVFAALFAIADLLTHGRANTFVAVTAHRLVGLPVYQPPRERSRRIPLAVPLLAAMLAAPWLGPEVLGWWRPAPPAHLRCLAADERGAAGVSFILTLPIYALILSMMVQLALIGNAKLVVRHAAYIAARSAQTNLPENRASNVRLAACLALTPISPAAPASITADAERIEQALRDAGGLPVPGQFARRYSFASRAASVSWTGGDDRSKDFAEEVDVTLRYKFLLTVPMAASILSPRQSVGGMTGRFMQLTETCRVTLSPGRNFGAGLKGYLFTAELQ